MVLKIGGIEIAVAPFFSAGRIRFERLDDRVFCLGKVFSSVLTDRAITTAYVTARKTKSESDRLSALFYAFSAVVALWCGVLDLI
jgi:hypothetical protein